jgi:hypothetical protein
MYSSGGGDKCPSRSLIYGLKPIVGNTVITGDIGDKSKYLKIEMDKYYCTNHFETFGSASLTVVSGYGWGYFPEGLDSKLPGYFVIPKSVLPYKFNEVNPKVSFAAILTTSFSQADQEYIAKNFLISQTNKSYTQSSNQDFLTKVGYGDTYQVTTDKSKLPNYINDYLNCNTKFIEGHVGSFMILNGEYKYNCPPSINTLGCNYNITYLQQTKLVSVKDKYGIIKYDKNAKLGWYCDVIPYGDGGESCMTHNNSDYKNFIYERKPDNSYNDCYQFPKSLFEEQDLNNFYKNSAYKSQRSR